MKRVCHQLLFVFLSLFIGPMLSAEGQGLSADPATPAYKMAIGVSGQLRSVGSDTVSRLMSSWEEAFQEIYEGVNVIVEAKGSATAPPALLAGTAQIGPMSREMTPVEIDAFTKKYGYPPSVIRVAVDALAVFVNKENPIKGLTLTQVDGIFSSTGRRGGKDITQWGELGLGGDWANRYITLYGRNSASGTHAFFKESALGRGHFKDTTTERPGSGLVIQAVGWDLIGIGYSGIGFKSTAVKVLPLGRSLDNLIEPTAANALDGSYPLSRFLFIYFNKAPGKPLEKTVSEFLKFVVSREGQQIVVENGFFALPAATCVDEMAKLR
jgi:phosphate transport system substrate-binding protein